LKPGLHAAWYDEHGRNCGRSTKLDIYTITHAEHIHQVDYTNTYAEDKHHVAFSDCSDVFHMLLHGVWQIMSNQLLCIQQNNRQLYFHVYDRIRVGGEFAIIRHHSFIPSADG
jgi:hypothetical protein